MGLNLLSQPAQAAALNWNFFYTASNVGGAGVTGTVNAILTTDGTGYDTTTLYNITSISGTANGSNITGLWTTNFPGQNYTADNKFRWNGTTGIILSFDGIAFSNSASKLNNIYQGNSSLRNYFMSTSGASANDGSVSFSSLTPAAAVPEPLTILGAVTAVGFGAGFKRKLAKSIKK